MRHCLLVLVALMVSLMGAQTLEERFELAYQEAIQAAQKIEEASVRSLALRNIASAMAGVGRNRTG